MAAPKTRMPVPSNPVPLSVVSVSGPPPTDHHGRKQPASASSAPIAARNRDRPTGRRCMVMPETAGSLLGVDLRPEHTHEPEVAVQLAVVKAVAHDELVGNGEAGVVDVDLDEAAGRLVEQGAD